MTEFLLFDSFLLSRINTDQTDTLYELFHNNKWLRLHGIRQWPRSISARTHDLGTPWTIKNLSPIPSLDQSCTNFTTVLDSIVSDYCTEIATNDKQVYINWSGGIDSTAILVAFLKNASSDILDRVTVVCDSDSITENPYFYYKFVEPKFKLAKTYKVDITNDNYANMIVLDGELGDQCFYGHDYVLQLAMCKQFDLLRTPWKNAMEHCVLKEPNYSNADAGTVKFAMDLIVESIDYSPIEITSLHDFLWWAQFNFKWDENNLRKLTLYTDNLDGTARGNFYKNSLRRVFSDPRMQQWSMLTLGRRSSLLETDIKYDAKRYIYDFDKNDLYFAHRTKLHSGQDWSDDTFNFGYNTMALDVNWAELQLTCKEDRRTIAEMLQTRCILHPG